MSTFNRPPEITIARSPEEEIQTVGKWLAMRTTEGVVPHEIGVFVRSAAELTRAVAASEGTTMFFSSHQLSEVESIADHIGIIDQGKTIVSGSLDDMKARYQRITVVFGDLVQTPARWVEGVESVREEGRMVSILASHNVEVIVEQA